MAEIVPGSTGTNGGAAPSQAPEPTKPAGVGAPAASDDQIRALAAQLASLRLSVIAEEHALGLRLPAIAAQAALPGRASDGEFRQRLAYALEDVEKVLGRTLDLDPVLRAEMTDRAQIMPDLTNERMSALLRETRNIADSHVVSAIRQAASSVASQADQSSPEVVSAIEALERQYGMAERQRPTAAAAQDPAAKAAAQATAASQNVPPAVAGSDPTKTGRNDASTPQPTARGGTGEVMMQHSVLDTLLQTVRGGFGPRENPPPWEPKPTPMGARLAEFEQRVAERENQPLYDRTLQSGREAAAALKAFNDGPAAAILGRIEAAAKTDPGGMAGVLAEMKAGGRFADLRQQFNTVLAHEQGAAAAYDKAAAALARYGSDRVAAQDAAAAGPNPAATLGRFEELDAELGQTAAATPSRNDGKSMVDDLTERAIEIFQRAVDTVRAAFTRSPAAQASASPSPSPGI